ncbi:MAG: rod shape-determining protein [Desulfovibrionales bacterium]
MQRYVQNKYQMLIGENMAEIVKKKVGAALPLKKTLTCRVTGKYLVNGAPKSVDITDREVSEAIREPVNAIVSAVGRALDKTPPELISDILDQGMLLAGGGALLKGLDQLISRKLQLKVIVDQDPLTTVVRGTGITLGNLKKFSEVYIN